jgi:hypothetical protein
VAAVVDFRNPRLDIGGKNKFFRQVDFYAGHSGLHNGRC